MFCQRGVANREKLKLVLSVQSSRFLASQKSLAEKLKLLGSFGDAIESLDEKSDDVRRSAFETDDKGEPFRPLYVQPNRKSPLRQKLEIYRRRMTETNFLRVTDLEGTRGARCEEMSPSQDWPSVWPAAASFNPSVVPLPIRMGFVKGEKLVPDKWLNLELVKIPNFLHLTPEHIRRHCAAIKKFCTKWPWELKTKKDYDKFYPLHISYSDYCHTGTSIRDMRYRIVTTEFQLAKTFQLDSRAYDKFIRLCGDRYDQATDTITIVTDRCYTRKQNLDYAMYLLTALYHESMKEEEWEVLKERADERWVRFENSRSQQKLIQILATSAQHADDQNIERLGVPKPSKDIKEKKADESALKDHELVKEHAKVWEEYRNRPETIESVKTYEKSVRELLNIPPLENSDQLATDTLKSEQIV